MLKFRLLLIVLVVVVLAVLPLSAAGAQDSIYYCSATRTTGGSGTYYDPWACSNDTQMATVSETICRAGGGTLYQIQTGAYQIFTIRWTGNMCEMTVGPRNPGYPPNTGVDLPDPVLYGGLALVGGSLVAGGWLLRRKNLAV